MPRLVNGFQSNTDYFCTSVRDSEDGQLLHRAFDTDEYVDWMRSLNTLINDDVMSQNSLVDNATAFAEKCSNGQYAVLYGQVPNHANSIDGSEGGWSYRPVWVNTPVNQNFGGFGTVGTVHYYGIFKDSLTDEQLDQLVHAINYLVSGVGTNNFLWGPESAGLFTEDEDGNRTFVDSEVEAYWLNNEDNGAGYKYGLLGNLSANESAFYYFPTAPGKRLLEPSYLAAADVERSPGDAFLQYNPGILEGLTYSENTVRVANGCEVYSLGLQVESLAQFWTAREGFENQIKKVIAATPENFDKELDNLILYADENGLTEEAIKEFNDLFIETNRVQLQDAGLIE